MLTGVKSSVILDVAPDAAAIAALADRNGCVISLIDLADGRVKVESFAAVDSDDNDLVSTLRTTTQRQRVDLDALRLP